MTFDPRLSLVERALYEDWVEGPEIEIGGAPAAAGGIQFLDGFAHLFGGVTLPAFRRRGVLRTWVAVALDIIAERVFPT